MTTRIYYNENEFILKPMEEEPLPATEIQSNKNVTIETNTTTEITPDTNYDALAKITVTTHIPTSAPTLETITTTITTNTSLQITPTIQGNAISLVNLNIEVPTTGQTTKDILQETTITSSVTEIKFENFVDNTKYHAYVLEFWNLKLTTSTNRLQIKLGQTTYNDQTQEYETIYSTKANDYYSNSMDVLGSSIRSSAELASSAYFPLGSSNSNYRPTMNYPITGKFMFYIDGIQGSTINGTGKYEGIRNASGSITPDNGFMGIYFKNSDNYLINSIRLYPNVENIETGTIRLYGKY